MNFPVASYDGYAEIWVNSMDDVTAIATDEEYLERTYKDEQYLTNREEWQCMITYTEDIWENGKDLRNIGIKDEKS